MEAFMNINSRGNFRQEQGALAPRDIGSAPPVWHATEMCDHDCDHSSVDYSTLVASRRSIDVIDFTS